jgi:hypothetical protein
MEAGSGSGFGSTFEWKAGSGPDPDTIEVKTQDLKVKMEPWMAVKAHKGDVEAQNGALDVLNTSGHSFASL